MTVPENPIGGWNATLNGFQSIWYVNGHVDTCILYSMFLLLFSIHVVRTGHRYGVLTPFQKAAVHFICYLYTGQF